MAVTALSRTENAFASSAPDALPVPRPVSSPASAGAAARRSRAASIGLWTAQVLLAALFVFAGINKLLGLQEEMIRQFARIGLGTWFRYFVGTLELAGGLGLLIPRLSGLAALGLAGVMVGAIFTHILVLPPVYFAAFPAIFAAGFLLIARARRSEIRTLLARIRPS